MPFLLLDSCCCCINLRTGCLIIGYLELVTDVISVICALIVAISTTHSASSSRFEDAGTQHAIESKDMLVSPVLVSIYTIVLLLVVLGVVFTIIMLVGVHKNKRGHLKMYLIFSTILLTLAIIVFLSSLWITSINDVNSIFLRLFLYALRIYFLLVVRSYYYQMNTNNPAVFSMA